jgi:hypothetical protein
VNSTKPVFDEVCISGNVHPSHMLARVPTHDIPPYHMDVQEKKVMSKRVMIPLFLAESQLQMERHLKLAQGTSSGNPCYPSTHSIHTSDGLSTQNQGDPQQGRLRDGACFPCAHTF